MSQDLVAELNKLLMNRKMSDVFQSVGSVVVVAIALMADGDDEEFKRLSAELFANLAAAHDRHKEAKAKGTTIQ